MLNRTWRIVLLIVALLLLIRPTLLGDASQWIGVIAVVILLIAEFSCADNCDVPKSSPRRTTRTRTTTRRKTTTRRRRR